MGTSKRVDIGVGVGVDLGVGVGTVNDEGIDNW
jgi:hypothetical protein